MGIRKTLALGALLVGMSSPALALQAAAVEGAWRNPAGGTCDAAFFKSGELTMTPRGETAVKVMLNNAGMMFEGNLVIEGARRGQLVSAADDRAIFLIDTPGGKVRVIPMALDYRSWPETILELCPGTRP